MTGSPVMICVEHQTYICAITALEYLAGLPAHKGPTATRFLDAYADLKRAHAMFLLYESAVLTPALLKRQAT